MDNLQVLVSTDILSGVNENKCELLKGDDSKVLTPSDRVIFSSVSDAFLGDAPNSMVNVEGLTYESNTVVLRCSGIDFSALNINETNGFSDALPKIITLNNLTMGYEIGAATTRDEGTASYIIMNENIGMAKEKTPMFDAFVGVSNSSVVDGLVDFLKVV